MKTSWGKTYSANSNRSDDRIELIDDTAEARAEFGENYGAFEFKLTPEQVKGLLAGKVVAFDISEREYTGYLSLRNK
ncbi:MAG: hypothetical protein RW306_15860 [Geobacteraceae bacterium]|nr:hypothetical protein [Geobacteraceae bacterium]